MIKYRTPDDILIEVHKLYITALPSPTYSWLRYVFGEYAIGRSILMYDSKDEIKFRKIVHDINPGNMLEIGTANGISSLILSDYANKVITIDIHKFPMAEVLWFVTRRHKKIDSYILEKNEQLNVDFLDFDCAFIDGDHSYEGVKSDFEAVKRCGKVLFHDYWPLSEDRCDGPKKFIDTLPRNEVNVMYPFAYWEKK